jgi:hypothetical protein
MNKFEVTDAMLDAAEQAYDTIAAIEHDAWCYTAPTRAAISAAIEASGVLEENARLREALRKIERVARGSAEIMRDQKRTGRWEGAERTANAFERLSKDASQALNKEPTP